MEEEGSAQLFTALRGDSWWIIARTGDGQESIKGPYATESLADEQFYKDLPKFLEVCKSIGLNTAVSEA